MEFHGIPIGSLWGLATRLPTYLLRHFFPKDKLAALQYVDLQPRHASATLNLGESASLDIWLNIINLSPFEVELDRAEISFWYGGVISKCRILKKQNLLPGVIATLNISELIPDGHANQMARVYCANDAGVEGTLQGYIEFNCKLHSFCKNIGNLSGVNPRVINANIRVQQEQRKLSAT